MLDFSPAIFNLGQGARGIIVPPTQLFQIGKWQTVGAISNHKCMVYLEKKLDKLRENT